MKTTDFWKKEDQWISYQPLLTNSADFMPLKMQKDTSGGGGKGGVVEGIKKKINSPFAVMLFEIYY